MSLSLTCPVPNKRPIRVTDEMARIAAEKVAASLGAEVGPVDEVIGDILKVTRDNRSMDGFQIAHRLANDLHWDCDIQMANALDAFSRYCRSQLDAAVRLWGRENPMEPPYPLGTLVETPHGNGVITQIYSGGIAQYIIPIGDRRLIVAFEDCSAVVRGD